MSRHRPTQASEPRGTRFAVSALVVYAAGSLIVLVLEISERNGLISELMESTVRLLVCTILFGHLIYAGRALPRAARLGVVTCATFLLVSLFFGVIQDTQYFDQLPLIGHNSRWRHAVEKILISCWACSTFYMMFVLMSQLEASYGELQTRQDDQKKANSDLQRTMSELRKAQARIVQQERLAALGQMASGVAHDLNNALTPVVLFSRLIKEDELPEKHRQSFQMIQASAEHAGQVVKQLQHFYRGSSSRPGDQAVVRLSEVIHQAAELTRYRWHDEALKQGLRFDVELPKRADLRLIGHHTELVQMMINLLMNAMDAMPNGGRITVSVALADGLISLAVSDNGQGMSDGQRARCFEPFYTTKSSGSGLGLSVCHGIARRHGGTIEARSNLEGGSTFVIQLPDFAGEEVASTSPPEAEPTCGLKRVLLIDDDEIVRESVSALLTSLGAQVHTAVDGPNGLEIACQEDFDLVITDLSMPRMTGREVVAELRKRFPRLPIAVASGWAGGAVSDQFHHDDAKPDYILEKPIGIQAMNNCLLGL